MIWHVQSKHWTLVTTHDSMECACEGAAAVADQMSTKSDSQT